MNRRIGFKPRVGECEILLNTSMFKYFIQAKRMRINVPKNSLIRSCKQNSWPKPQQKATGDFDEIGLYNVSVDNDTQAIRAFLEERSVVIPQIL